MFDIRLIRENPKAVEENLKRRNDAEKIALLKEVIADDKKYREDLAEMEKLKHDRNVVSEEIAALKKSGKDVSAKVKEAAELPKKIKALEDEVVKLKEKIDYALMRIPNMLHESVPIGKDDTENVVVKTWGTAPKFNFQPKNHEEILTKLGLLDEESAAKVTGRGFYYLKGSLAMLNQAIIKYAIDLLTNRGLHIHLSAGDAEARRLRGHGRPRGFRERDVQDRERRPLHDSDCRALDGSHVRQRDTEQEGSSDKVRGTEHQLQEGDRDARQVHERSVPRAPVRQGGAVHLLLSRGLLEAARGAAEELRGTVSGARVLHYRVVNVCTGDIGSIAAKKYDTECWMADGVFRETGSNSNCTDYQARRINIKYRDKEGQAPAGFVHTLNNTALATSRTMVCLIEQNQQADGTVAIPKAALALHERGKEIGSAEIAILSYYILCSI